MTASLAEVLSRGNPQKLLETAVEVTLIRVAHRQGSARNPFAPVKAFCGFSNPHSLQIGVRRETHLAREGSGEIVWTQGDESCELR